MWNDCHEIFTKRRKHKAQAGRIETGSLGATTRLLEFRKVENAEKSIFADAWLGYGIFLIFFPIFPGSAPIRPTTYPNFIQIGKLDLENNGGQGRPCTEKTVFSNFLEKVPRRGSRDMASRERIYKAYRMSHHASKSIEASKSFLCEE